MISKYIKSTFEAKQYNTVQSLFIDTIANLAIQHARKKCADLCVRHRDLQQNPLLNRRRELHGQL